MTFFPQIFEIHTEAFPGVLVCALAARDPSCWCRRSASPSWSVVQAAFKMRNFLSWIEMSLAETSAKPWPFFKPACWDSARGHDGLGRCRMSRAFSSPRRGSGRTPSSAWLGCTSMGPQDRRRIWAWRGGWGGSVVLWVLGSPGRPGHAGAEHRQPDRRWHSSAGWLEPLTASLVSPSSPDISFHVGSQF